MAIFHVLQIDNNTNQPEGYIELDHDDSLQHIHSLLDCMPWCWHSDGEDVVCPANCYKVVSVFNKWLMAVSPGNNADMKTARWLDGYWHNKFIMIKNSDPVYCPVFKDIKDN